MQDQAAAKQKQHSGGFPKRLIFISVGIAIVALGAILYITVGKASIILRPHSEPLALKMKVIASTKVQTVDMDLSRIPGQQFSVRKEAKGTYQMTTTKEVAQKAKGRITIYNKSTTPQRLVATTRFETPKGLIFRIPATLTVAASSSIESAVYADRPGTDYNIGATTFTVPGLMGTPNFVHISATSAATMSGGSVGNAKVVTEQDFSKAQVELSQKAKQEVANALNEQTDDLRIPGDTPIKIAGPVANARVDDAADELIMSVTASADAIAFRESDVRSLIANYLEKNGNLEATGDDVKFVYSGVLLDAAAKTLTFQVEVTGQASVKIDREKIIRDVQGMNEQSIRAYFKDNKDIESARILLSPFWVASVPKDPKKIDITIETK